jgi:hypothetical protein
MPTCEGGSWSNSRKCGATWPFAGAGAKSSVAQIGALYLGVADGESFTKQPLKACGSMAMEGQNIAFAFALLQGRPERLPLKPAQN